MLDTVELVEEKHPHDTGNEHEKRLTTKENSSREMEVACHWN